MHHAVVVARRALCAARGIYRQHPNAAPQPCRVWIGLRRIEPGDLFERGDCLVEPPERSQRRAACEIGVDLARPQPHGLVERRESGLVLARAGQLHTRW